ncbi:MAG: DUF2158 domain-containing protein [Deltaproteobacteria bacterium]|nr:DUF2158 domain-containing protein [Deltaproteobacteria bacterium]
MTWKVGDVVRLKSGGPAMTVAVVDKHEQVLCQWFGSGGDFKDRMFVVGTLEAVVEDAPAGGSSLTDDL